MLTRLFGGHGDLQAVFRLFPFQVTRVAKQAYLGHLAVGRGAGQRPDKSSLARPGQKRGVQDVAIPDEAEIAAGKRMLPPVVDELARAVGLALAVNAPRARSVNAFAVHVHPPGQSFEELQFILIDRAVAADRDVQQQIAVLADDIHQLFHDAFHGAILEAAPIMPVADAGVGLPRVGLDAVGAAALEIVHQAFVNIARRLKGEQVPFPALEDKAGFFQKLTARFSRSGG